MPNFFEDENTVPFLPEDFFMAPTVDEDLQEEVVSTPPVSGVDPDVNSGTLFNPEPNPMSSLNQPTYYFKLYVLNDLNPSEEDQVVIAETGNTSLNITDVTIDGIVGPNMRTRNSMATNITIKLTEPYGMNLPDRMVAAARQLKIRNYLKASFMLRLNLHGYDAVGQRKTVGDGWCWRIMIIDVKTKVTEAGAEHTITAIPYPEVALQDRNGVLPTNISVEGKTVGEIVKNLTDRLNKYFYDIHGFDFVTYEIVDVPYPEGVSEGVSRPFDHEIDIEQLYESERMMGADQDSARAQFSQGSDIPALIDNIFSASLTAVRLATLERSIFNQREENAEPSRSPTSVLHRIDTYVDNLKYDPIYGDYQKKITFVIRPYESMRIQSGLTSAASSQIQDAQTKIQHAIKRLFLCKQYDYIYTGLNTEIEKFDIELNFRWAVSAPLVYQDGATTSTYDGTTVPKAIRDSSGSNLTPEQRRQAITNLTNERIPILDSIRNDTSLSEQERAEKRSQYEELTRTQGQLMNEARVETEKRKAQLQEAEDVDDLGVVLAEDLDIELSSAHPVTINKSGEDPSVQAGLGLPSRRDGTKSVYGTLLNQLYGTFDGNLQTITLEIRGDPYWLGPDPTPMGNYGILDSSTVANRFPSSSSEQPNLLNGEHMFAFNFGLPQGFNDSTGSVRLSHNETYSGFYAVTQVEHMFSQGKFTQKLQAYRIPGIALNDLNNEAEETSLDSQDDLSLNQPTASQPLETEVQTSTRFNPPPVDGFLEGYDEDLYL